MSKVVLPSLDKIALIKDSFVDGFYDYINTDEFKALPVLDESNVSINKNSYVYKLHCKVKRTTYIVKIYDDEYGECETIAYWFFDLHKVIKKDCDTCLVSPTCNLVCKVSTAFINVCYGFRSLEELSSALVYYFYYCYFKTEKRDLIYD
jgi:hypothetical protein